jgi:hypothetical protein
MTTVQTYDNLPPQGWECPVCLDNSDVSGTLKGHTVQAGGAKHIFHSNCLDQWLSDHNTCPVCRESLENRTIERIEAPNENQPGESALLKDLIDSSKKYQQTALRLKNLVIPIIAVCVGANIFMNGVRNIVFPVIGGAASALITSTIARKSSQNIIIEGAPRPRQNLVPLTAGIVAATTLGIIATGGALPELAGYLLLGNGIFYALDEAAKNNTINGETKKTLQEVTVVASVALSAAAPIATMFTWILGGVIGSVIESARYAKLSNRRHQIA